MSFCDIVYLKHIFCCSRCCNMSLDILIDYWYILFSEELAQCNWLLSWDLCLTMIQMCKSSWSWSLWFSDDFSSWWLSCWSNWRRVNKIYDFNMMQSRSCRFRRDMSWIWFTAIMTEFDVEWQITMSCICVRAKSSDHTDMNTIYMIFSLYEDHYELTSLYVHSHNQNDTCQAVSMTCSIVCYLQ